MENESEAIHMEYEQLVTQYERNLEGTTARKLQEFKDSFAPTDIELNIGKALFYLLSDIDPKIDLKSDKSDIIAPTWEKVQAYISGFGDIFRNLKLVRPHIEK